MNPLAGGSSGGSTGGLLASLTPLAASANGYKGTPAAGTGILQLITWGEKQKLITPVTINAIIPNLQGLFGGYPTNTPQEKGPDGLFIALFAVLMIAHFSMWIINLSRRHNFFLQLGFAFFCCLKVIGYACRIAWAHDITKVKTGIASVVFIQVAQLILESLNMVLAHRIFTWRHPETGTHWVIVQFLNLIYFIVLAVIIMAILGQCLPYVYFMGQHHYNMCKNVMKAAAVLNLYYACLPLQLLFFAYAFKPGLIVKTPKVFNKVTHQEERVLPPVHQASWIQSAGLFYYPSKNSQVRIYKGEPGSEAVRIIPSREPPGNGHRSVGEHVNPNAPHLHWATLTVTITTLVLILNTCFRVAACFKTGAWATSKGTGWSVNHWQDEPYVMFIFYGATEALVLAFYLLMRVDLRFYIPDMPSKPPKDGIPDRNYALEENPGTNWADAPEFEKDSNSHDSDSQVRA